ncbi:hypothetical protein [Streptomyces sp. NPDC050145]|uniref:hypothetical protein n=1 Tax=Streptomyces sp. NPDC050145 TaxID=3365602 RepID=UPI0037AC4153
MRRRRQSGSARVRVLRQVRERAAARRQQPVERRRKRFGRRAERVRPWLQFLADLAALLARVVS